MAVYKCSAGKREFNCPSSLSEVQRGSLKWEVKLKQTQAVIEQTADYKMTEAFANLVHTFQIKDNEPNHSDQEQMLANKKWTRLCLFLSLCACARVCVCWFFYANNKF